MKEKHVTELSTTTTLNWKFESVRNCGRVHLPLDFLQERIVLLLEKHHFRCIKLSRTREEVDLHTYGLRGILSLMHSEFDFIELRCCLWSIFL